MRAEDFKEALAKDDLPVKSAVDSIVDEAIATRGHFTVGQAIAVLIVERTDRGILRPDEAKRIFDRLIDL